MKSHCFYPAIGARVMKICRATLVAIFIITSACVGNDHRLTKLQVFAIADRVAVKHGYSLGKFDKHARYYFADKTWTVFYDLKPDSHGLVPVGGDFTVDVRDDTKETFLLPGR
jgi:hypothetical protein